MTVLLLGGVMIGATAISGIVLIYSVRQATQVKYSTQAIYAADAGLEWELYRYYQDALGQAPPTFINGAALETCSFNDVDGSGVNTGKCTNAADPELSMRSVGKAGGAREVRRAFELLFTEE